VYGPAEDPHYFRECQALCAEFDDNIKVIFHGEIEHDKVHDIFSGNHLFFFPTHGENFGHVILEAMCAGCPVLISDQTPWINLDAIGVGWDIPLNRPDRFKVALEKFVSMDFSEFEEISKCAMTFGKKKLADPSTTKQNRDLFHAGINGIRIATS
jgi:glycosyltransferase involved in cell wall biosynthesis